MEGQQRIAYASWGRRVFASILDSIFIFLILLAIGLGVGIVVGFYYASQNEPLPDFNSYPFIELVLSILVASLYAPLLYKRQNHKNGQSWGKEILKIRVVNYDLQAMEFPKSFLREAIYKGVLFGSLWSYLMYLDPLFLLPGVAVISLNYLWPLWDDEKRAWHDKLVNTRVLTAEQSTPENFRIAKEEKGYLPPMPPERMVQEDKDKEEY